MSRITNLDFKGIEKQERYIWGLVVFLILSLAASVAAIYIFTLPSESTSFSSPTYNVIAALTFFIVIFCLYVAHTRAKYGRIKNLVIEMSELLSSTVELEILLPFFAKKIAERSRVTFCQIALFSDAHLILKTAYGSRTNQWEPQIGKSYDIHRMPILNRTIQSRQTVIVDRHIFVDPNAQQDDIELLTGGAKNCSDVLLLPMAIEGKVIGILILGDTQRFNRNRFSQSEVALIEAMSRHLTTAINCAALVAKEKKTTESLLQATMDATVDGLLVVDLRNKIINFNQQFVRMWKTPDPVIATRDNDNLIHWVQSQIKKPELFLESSSEKPVLPVSLEEAVSHLTLELIDGRVFEYSSRPQYIDGIMVGRVWNFRNITDFLAVKSELEHNAITDALTGLYNRRYFSLRIKKELRSANRKKEPICIALCDLDGFKQVNDTKGHQAGDEVLKSISAAILNEMRATDLAFRWGGDEILLILPMTKQEGIQAVANRIRNAVLKISGQSGIALDISIGIVFYPDHGTNIDELIGAADRAMYFAKKGTTKILIGEESLQSTKG